MNDKERVLEIYKEAALDAYDALQVSKDSEYGAPERGAIRRKVRSEASIRPHIKGDLRRYFKGITANSRQFVQIEPAFLCKK